MKHIAHLLCLLALSAGLLTASGPTAFAQSEVPQIDTNLTEAEFQAMLGRLSDEQVRDILIAEFAARREADAAPSEDGLLTNARGIGDVLTTNTKAVLAKWPEMGTAFATVRDRLSAAGGVWLAFAALALCLAIGLTVRRYWQRKATVKQMQLAERNIEKGSYGTVATIGDAAVILLLEISSSIAFAVAALATLYVVFPNPDIRVFVSSYLAMATIVLMVRSLVHFMFPQEWPMYRLVAMSDGAARLAHWIIIGLACIWTFETATAEILAEFGAPTLTPELFSLLLSLVWITTSLTSIYLMHRATRDILPGPEETGLGNALNRNWAGIMTFAQIVTWIVFSGGALVIGDVDLIAGNVFWSLATFVGFWMAYRILVHYLRAQDLDTTLKDSIGRAARALLLAVGLILILDTWGLDTEALAAGGTAGRGIQTIINVALTALIGWSIWDLIRTVIDVRAAAETPAGATDEGADGEGGLGASRTATLLPLLRSFALAAIGLTCLFAALSSMGVNVAPLIAGAGVIGLAIGFGAQTLVKDVVSGVFFLIDDAFRRGEYIDLGAVKGTVERISIRSLQLRHHLGAVHTIPFGDIAALTNYSRDWVIMKLPLRLTFDTDPQKVKKIVKTIGAQLMEDELVGDGLIEPPKSQGVIQMEDSAMILRVKFKAIPGKQFTIRRELLHRIRAAFEEAGIRFANREVTVRVNEDATPEERKEAITGAATRAVEEEQQAQPAPT